MSRPLPAAPDYDGAHLRHVMASAAGALGLEGFENRLGVPEASIAVVVMVDGLGDENLARHTGHARFLASAWRHVETARVLDCGAPATTAASLTSLGTGLTPGETGMIGYDLYAEHLGRVVNMLGKWPGDLDPSTWQPHPTVLGRAQAAGASVLTVSRPQFRSSPLTRASLSGGQFLGAERIEHRFSAAADWISEQRASKGVRRGPAAPLLVYLYVDELDRTGHRLGAASPEWREYLENLDASARRFSAQLSARFGEQAAVLLTADHGMVDVPRAGGVDVAGRGDLLEGVAHTAGDPRMVYLHARSGADPEEIEQRWRAEFEGRAWVLAKQEAVEAGWFGPVSEPARSRIGDVIVAAYEDIAVFDTARSGAGVREMVGQHGSLTDAERKVPLLELTGRVLTRS
ncbi:alkaline phosphatase family protein [Nesterenkonia populi]|uniref:alkaline phosphatase family protein n=1 Tax=Nesterenkonia populi TaxID=1591087 RepID=UPI0011BE4779|nr:nucleotide pyrophosphatase/phosphodiesterase family protein [Nesterenkonia populi]